MFGWNCGSMLVSHTKGGRFEAFYCDDKYFVNEFGETFKKTALIPININTLDVISDQ